ncbi:MAG TPA: hypothetical protein VGJ45_34910 [Pseudonocardiaceae bacterium]
MDTEHVAFLVVGVVVVFLVGQLLISAGRRYLARSAPGEQGAAAPAATLLAVLFHLLTLGIVALIAVLPIGGSSTTKFLVQAGILLIALAIIYGIALNLLGRRRDEAMVAEFESRAHPPATDARLTVRPKVDYDNGELGHSEYGRGIPSTTPMDPSSGTAMGQPESYDSL